MSEAVAGHRAPNRVEIYDYTIWSQNGIGVFLCFSYLSKTISYTFFLN